MKSVYNRGFSSGFYFGKPSSVDYADIYGSKATSKKVFTGKVLNYYQKAQAAYIRIDSGCLKTNDEILIIGPTTGVVNLKLENILKDDIKVNIVGKGDKITFICDTLIRPNDNVYLISKSDCISL